MSKTQILVVIACVSVILASCARNAQARPGPTMNESATSNPEKALNDRTADVLKIHAAVTDSLPVPAEVVESEGEEEMACSEEGKCYEKRLLTAAVDYENDGPNNPITDPPH